MLPNGGTGPYCNFPVNMFDEIEGKNGSGNGQIVFFTNDVNMGGNNTWGTAHTNVGMGPGKKINLAQYSNYKSFCVNGAGPMYVTLKLK